MHKVACGHDYDTGDVYLSTALSSFCSLIAIQQNTQRVRQKVRMMGRLYQVSYLRGEFNVTILVILISSGSQLRYQT